MDHVRHQVAYVSFRKAEPIELGTIILNESSFNKVALLLGYGQETSWLVKNALYVLIE
jgi:hypothetical protein